MFGYSSKTILDWFKLGTITGSLLIAAYWLFAVALGLVNPPWSNSHFRLTIREFFFLCVGGYGRKGTIGTTVGL